MKLKLFDDTGLFLPCGLFLAEPIYNKQELNRIKNIIRLMLKVEKDSQKWKFEREDENYLYYKWERKKGTTYYKMNKKYWKEEL